MGNTKKTPRIDLVPLDTPDPILKPLFERMLANGGVPFNVHRTAANTPDIFKAASELSMALRWKTTAPRRDRELVILRTSQHNRGEYEFVHHREMAMEFGVTEAQIEALDRWQQSDQFDDRDRALLAYVDALARREGVSDAVFNALLPYYSRQQIMELTFTSGFYALWAMMSDAFEVQLEEGAGRGDYAGAMSPAHVPTK